jgi:hypothetical protein
LTILAYGIWFDDWWRRWPLFAWVAVCVGVHIVSTVSVIRARRILALVLITVGVVVHLALAIVVSSNAVQSWRRNLDDYLSLPLVPDVAPPACWTRPSSPTHAQLMAAPTRAVVGGKTLALNAGAGRDLMPDMGPARLRSGRLTVKAVLAAVDATPLPRGVDLDRVWVIKSPTECWETPHTAETRGEYRGLSPEHMARELVGDLGPRWEPGTEVDIIARVVVPGKPSLLLRATKVPVTAVY